MSTVFRALTEREQRAIEAILSVEFRNHQKLKIQVRSLALRPLDETIYELAPLSSVLQSRQGKPRRLGIPVECTYEDKDNSVVYVDLFVDETDALVELEIWKPNGSEVKTYFADADLTISVRGV